MPLNYMLHERFWTVFLLILLATSVSSAYTPSAPPAAFPGDSLTGSPQNTTTQQQTQTETHEDEELPPSPPPIESTTSPTPSAPSQTGTTLSGAATTPPPSSPQSSPSATPPSMEFPDDMFAEMDLYSFVPWWIPAAFFGALGLFLLQTLLVIVIAVKVFSKPSQAPPTPPASSSSLPLSSVERVPVEYPLAAQHIPPHHNALPTPDMMVVRSLREYVASCRAQGFPDERIRAELMKSGRLPIEIDLAMSR